MTTFFLIIIIIVLIVQLNNKSKDGVNNNLYQRGYQDGWDALKSHVSVLLGKDKINKKDLQDIVAKGPMNGAAPVAHAAQRVARPPVDEKARALRNTNIVLYLASFLFVAAGAAFIAAAVDDTVKLIGVWLLVAAFYGSGLYIHSHMKRLKPAAVAFAQDAGTDADVIDDAGLDAGGDASVPGDAAVDSGTIIPPGVGGSSGGACDCAVSSAQSQAQFASMCFTVAAAGWLIRRRRR